MIDAMELARWTRRPLLDGGVVMIAPGGAEVASLVIRSGRRPVWPLRTIVAELTRHEGAMERGPITRFVTDDGEHGAWIALRRGSGDATLDRVIATVATEDEQLVVEGTGRGAQVADWVLCVARALPSSAPCDRVRMFAYHPPAGWFGVRRALATCWLPRTYPRSRARIIVCDAAPLTSSVARTVSLLWPSTAHRTEPFRHVELSGTRSVHRAGTTISSAIELACSRFHYRVLLHDGSPDDLAVVDALVATIEPCPRPQRDASSIMEAFSWMT